MKELTVRKNTLQIFQRRPLLERKSRSSRRLKYSFHLEDLLLHFSAVLKLGQATVLVVMICLIVPSLSTGMSLVLPQIESFILLCMQQSWAFWPVSICIC